MVFLSLSRDAGSVGFRLGGLKVVLNVVLNVVVNVVLNVVVNVVVNVVHFCVFLH